MELFILVILLILVFLYCSRNKNIENLENVNDRLSLHELLNKSYDKKIDELGSNNTKEYFDNEKMMNKYNDMDSYHMLPDQTNNNFLNNEMSEVINNLYTDKRIKIEDNVASTDNPRLSIDELHLEKSKLGLENLFDFKILDEKLSNKYDEELVVYSKYNSLIDNSKLHTEKSKLKLNNFFNDNITEEKIKVKLEEIPKKELNIEEDQIDSNTELLNFLNKNNKENKNIFSDENEIIEEEEVPKVYSKKYQNFMDRYINNVNLAHKKMIDEVNTL